MLVVGAGRSGGPEYFGCLVPWWKWRGRRAGKLDLGFILNDDYQDPTDRQRQGKLR